MDKDKLESLAVEALNHNVDSKIQAIAELRQKSGLGLKEAKELIDKFGDSTFYAKFSTEKIESGERTLICPKCFKGEVIIKKNIFSFFSKNKKPKTIVAHCNGCNNTFKIKPKY